MKYSRLALLASLTWVSACSILPTTPSVMALPGSGKTFNQFRADDASCRQFAFEQVGGVSANQAATASAVGSGHWSGTWRGPQAPACLSGAHLARGPRKTRPTGCSAASTIRTSNACMRPETVFRSADA